MTYFIKTLMRVTSKNQNGGILEKLEGFGENPFKGFN